MTPRLQRLAAFGIAGLLFLLMAFAVTQSAPWYEEGHGVEDLDAIVQDLFQDHVIALEVLGVLLTAAMIGALVIARPLVGGSDRQHYARVDDDTLERTQHVSDLDATFRPGPAPPTPAGTPAVSDTRDDTTVMGGKE